MFQIDLDNGNPALPQGYRWLLKGEAKQQGDFWADMEFLTWEPCMSWKRGEIVREGGLMCIRKLESKDSVPFAQQKQLS